ncbi:MAG: ABC transporter ATP-binding protein [Pseudomonadota bacterium]
MLEVSSLEAGYGRSQVLFGVDLKIGAGEVVTLLGRNGMGKTTTIKSIVGLLSTKAGGIRFNGQTLSGQKPHRIGRMGVALVPEGRQIFPTLTVRENLVATSANRNGRESPWTLDRVYDLFPRLGERAGQMGSSLSGGEQQMLAIGRALMTNPHLLILDEATEGLAPIIRREIYDCLIGLKAEGESILIVDKNLDELSRIADSHVIIEKGKTCWQGDHDAFENQPDLKHRYLGV